jgi:nuclear pore complex protein Nup155
LYVTDNEFSFDLSLEERLEYLTLAVGNAKSHPVSASGRHETAIAFLTELEEKLEVAQVQLEMLHTLLPHIHDPGEKGEKVRLLSKTFYNITEVSGSFSVRYLLLIIL